MRKLPNRLLTLLCGLVVASLASAQTASTYRQQFPLPADSADGWAINTKDPDDATLQRIAATGVGFIRCDMSWQRVEDVKGVYNFAAYDNIVSKARGYGLRAIFILGYGNEHYDNALAPTSPEARQGYVNFVKAAVSRYQGMGMVWEIWNEPNEDQFWKPKANADAYTTLAVETGRGIRSVAPDEWVIGPALAGFDLTFLERCFQRGLLEVVDAVSVHPYRDSKVPETVLVDWSNVRGLVNRYKPLGRNVQVVSSEWGYSLLWTSKSQNLQAQYVVRSMLSNMLAGAGLTVSYQWRDLGNNSTSYHDWFGLNDYNGKERLSLISLRRFGQMLDGYRLATRLNLQSENDYAMVFTNGPDVRIVTWTSGAAKQITIPASVGSFYGTDFAGTNFEAQSDGSGLRVNVSGSPQILTATSQNTLLNVLARWTNLPSVATVGSEDDADNLIRPAIVSGAWDYAPFGTTLTIEDMADPANIFGGGDLRQTLSNLQTSTGLETGPGAESILPDLPRLQDRSDWARTLKLTVTLPDGTSASQVCELYHEQPMWAGVVTPQSSQLTLNLENPQGKAFQGTLYVTSKNGTQATYNVALNEGQYVTRVYIPEIRSQAMSNGYRFELRSADGLAAAGEAPVLQSKWLSTLRWADPVDGQYSVPLAGSSTVSGSALIKVAGAPAGAGITNMKSLRIDYKMGDGFKYMSLNPPKALATGRYSKFGYVGFWFYSDASGNTLRSRYQDESGQTFQYTIGKMEKVGWRWIEVPLDGYATTFWGGANNGIVQGTVRIVNPIIVDSRRDVATSGTIYVAGVTMVSTPSI